MLLLESFSRQQECPVMEKNSCEYPVVAVINCFEGAITLGVVNQSFSDQKKVILFADVILLKSYAGGIAVP